MSIPSITDSIRILLSSFMVVKIVLADIEKLSSYHINNIIRLVNKKMDISSIDTKGTNLFSLFLIDKYLSTVSTIIMIMMTFQTNNNIIKGVFFFRYSEITWKFLNFLY